MFENALTRFSLIIALLVAPLVMTPAMARPIGGFADLAEKLTPAVVNISTSQTVEERRSRGPGQPPFDRFFEEFFNQRRGGGGGNAPSQKVSSLGSGFVVSPSGIIITNNHVIEEADEITVTFSDGSKLDAELIGRDPKTDLAVLKVSSKKRLPFVPLGDSDKVRVGDWVIAIGNPFGLGGSLSAGVISAINRDINAGPYDSFIQTDAAINRGNSGGPLFNMKGEVIGVNSAIISPSGGSVGIGFSIPSNLAKTVTAQLQNFGETRRGWLGVRIQQVTDELADGLSLGKARGALVSEISPDGPAEKGGVKVGDVIVKFDGKPVPTMRDLPRIVAETKIDKPVQVEVIRRGKSRMLKIVTGRLEEASTKPVEEDRPQEKARTTDDMSYLGITVQSLSRENRQRFGLADDVIGAVIIDVARDSTAFEAGVRPGDVVSEIDQKPVGSAKAAVDALKAAKKSGRSSVLAFIRSGETVRFIAIPLSD
ncbi:MAG: DegQ family serine endoprotease [PS1 clade bacterium]|nr:DegQ family serine endoprotease [PS1 clade bacterium]MBL6783788.1 DegQ family serine endoprotease [PS1 clade bacterium]